MYKDHDQFQDAYLGWLNGRMFDIAEPEEWTQTELEEQIRMLHDLKEYKTLHWPLKGTPGIDDELEQIDDYMNGTTTEDYHDTDHRYTRL